MADPFIDRYHEICGQVADEFRRNRRLHRKRIHCRRGCTDCCHHLFQISEIEAASISAGVKKLPREQRRLLVEKANAYLPARDALMKQYGYIDAWGNLPAPGTRLACPALVEDACAIYEQRPLICRKFGMPLYHPEKPGRTFACELNFRPREVIEDLRLVPLQTSIASDWGRIQRDYDRAGGQRDEFPVSVADAIIRDFEEYLPQ